MKQGFINLFLAILIVLIGIGLLGYFAVKEGQIKIPSPQSPADYPSPVPTNTETTNWNTHSNSEFGFEFKYPRLWESFGSGGSGGYFKTPSGNFINLLIETGTSRTLEEHLQKKDEANKTRYLGGPLFEIQSSETGQANGLNYIQRREHSPRTDTTIRSTYFNNNNVFVNITFDYPPGNSIENDLTDYNKLITTYKFTDGVFTDRELIKAVSIYQDDQLSEEDKKMLTDLYWPKLKPFKSGDLEREVYLVNCAVTDAGFYLTGIPHKVQNKLNIIETTLKNLTEKHYGSFPDSKEIENYEKILSSKYKNRDSGINGVLLKDGVLQINFYDSVAAYGGGSSRVACMSQSASFTAQQFHSVKSVIMCIDKYPSEDNNNCAYDFQP